MPPAADPARATDAAIREAPYGPLMSDVRESLRGLVQCSKEAREGVERADSERHAAVGAAQRERRTMIGSLDERLTTERARILAQHEETTTRAKAERDSRMNSTKRQSAAALETAREKFEASILAIEKELADAVWMAETIDESNQRRLRVEHTALLKSMGDVRQTCDTLEERIGRALTRYGVAAPDAADDIELGSLDLDAETAAAEQATTALERLVTPRIANHWNLLIALLVGGATGAAVVAFTSSLDDWRLVAAAAGGGALALIIPLVILQTQGRARAKSLAGRVLRSVSALQRTADLATDGADDRLEAQLTGSIETRTGEADDARKTAGKSREENRRTHTEVVAAIKDKDARNIAEIEAAFTTATQRADRRRDEALAELESLDQAERPMVEERCARLVAEAERHAEATIRALNERLDAALRRMQSVASEVGADDARWSPAWEAIDAGASLPTDGSGGVARLGRVGVDVASMTGRQGAKRLTLPAWLELRGRGSLYVGAESSRRDDALALLRTAAARLLLAAPPGRVRLTIIDPVGLGASFAGFMRLLDHDPALVDHSVATDPREIEQRLARMTDHIESVIQKCLRNEHKDIHAYNAQAGDLAEPFHVLLLADLPQSISEPAARSLSRICRAGARCGVFVVAHHEASRPLPAGLAPEDFASGAIHIELRKGEARWKDEVFADWPLTIDAEPSDAALDSTLRAVGESWRTLKRVRVPFEGLAPSASDVWGESSARTLEIPIGFAGPGRPQLMSLGAGTRQHMLVAGRTGSGKSTLLHTLIASAALRYSPDEVELYLVDFKKGVEFKAYATERLPHARVVAIESDREFGLSVLQRLDEELRDRGRRFRDGGAQDVAGYRNARPDDRLPRVLLIVDEFQEFFVDDDAVAQNAALLLDRIVRQGRAFGMHVVLGSQTLGGTYNLARSTIGQMAVRIALQSSEQDASLILSEENRAAMDLTRPGEAIYNDESGAPQANNHFQVAWLDEDDRLGALARVRAESRSRRWTPPTKPIVFEGAALANVADNELLTAALAESPEHRPTTPVAYLGDAVAIKPPTQVAFGRTGVANMIIIGPRDDAAGALLVASLAGVLSTSGATGLERVWWLGQVSASENSLSSIAQRLGGEKLTVAGPPGAVQAIDDALALIESRRDASEPSPPAFVVLAGVHFLRTLWKREDDYSFGSDSESSVSRKLLRLLRDGPSLGVHVIAWIDSAANLRRTMEREAIGEFGHRVLFQMSGQDSSLIIDSPEASRLGLWRAILMDAEGGTLEKFRPYEMPDREWLDHAAQALHAPE